MSDSDDAIELAGPGDGARGLEPSLEELLQGQRRLEDELARARRRARWLMVAALLILGLWGALASLYMDHVSRPPVVLEGAAVEADVDALVARVEALQEQLEAARDDRNRHLAEAMALRQKVLAGEQRVGALTHGLDELAARAGPATADERPVVTSTADRALGSHPSRPLNMALAASGVDDLSFVECGAVRDGVLHGVFVADLDDLGLPAEAARYDRGWLEVDAGLVSLVLETALGDAGPPVPPRRVPMPRVDLGAWADAGLDLGEITTVAQVRVALSAMLEGQPFEVDGLSGWDGIQLLGLELVERDAEGLELARYEAERAELMAEGPTLLLFDGRKVVDGVARPFWQGRLRLVLAGASLERFEEALAELGDAEEVERG